MATSPYVVEGFSGLNLVDDPLEVGAQGSIDTLDADLDTRGRVRCRDGWTKFTSSALAGDVLSLAPYPNSGYLLAWANGTYYLLDSTGATTSSTTPGSSTLAPMIASSSPISIGTYNLAGHVMIAGPAPITFSGWSNVDLSAVVDVPDDWSVAAITPTTNRFVLAGGSTNPDRVVFGDPGAFTFTPANWIEVGGGDGDSILGAAVYRGELLVFKQTKFFAFTGESVDSDGGAIFNYRTVDTGVGLGARLGTATAPEGVYFLNQNGIFLTTGDAPTKVSGAIDPLFRGNVNSNTFSGSAINQTALSAVRMAYYRERLYVAVPTGSSTVNDRLLVLDPKTGAWLIWSIGAGSLMPFRRLVTATFQEEELFFGYATGANDIGRHSRSFTTDNGSAIAWNRKSGRYPLADAGHVAVTQESALMGSGTVTLRLDSDLYSNQSASATLGTAPAIAEGWPSPVDQEGTWLQHTLSGSGPGSVSRLTHLVSSVKPAGVR